MRPAHVIPVGRVLAVPVDGMRLSRLVLLCFLVAQVFDGLFTYVAVTALGPGAEGNAILSGWMMLVGPAPTLLVAKTTAALAGWFVYQRGLHVLLAALTLVYAAFAVAPWMHVYAGWP